MNRADRRRAGHRAPRSVSQFAATYECPDCLADVTYPIQGDDGRWQIAVLHSDTCPLYRRLKAAGLAT
ncbi:MAG: hypothetical protein ACLQLO_09635 [Mycobacterium sp.]